MYTNADGLPNKLDELKSRIHTCKVKPSIISVTEVKHKNKWDIDTAELSIDGYRLFANNYDENPRGIIIYVRNDVLCKQVELECTCTENIVLEIQINKNNILHFGTAYRSPNSTDDNNQAVLNFISKLSACPGYKLLLGDFNCPNINWDTWCASSPFELKFLDTLRKNFLIQYVDKPTRARGVDTPHTLDLVITEENFLQNLSYESPLGKSDHCVLIFDCKVHTSKKITLLKERYLKAIMMGFVQA